MGLSEHGGQPWNHMAHNFPFRRWATFFKHSQIGHGARSLPCLEYVVKSQSRFLNIGDFGGFVLTAKLALSSFFTKPISAVIAKHGMAERLWLDPTDFFYWLVVWNILFFPFSWECHHPKWRSPSFFRGVAQPPTRLLLTIINHIITIILTIINSILSTY